jgi:hypothetical protein
VETFGLIEVTKADASVYIGKWPCICSVISYRINEVLTVLRVIIILAVALSAVACNVNVNSDQANRLVSIRDNLKREEAELRARTEEARKARDLALQQKAQLPGSVSLSGASGHDARVLVELDFGHDKSGHLPEHLPDVSSFVTIDDNPPETNSDLTGSLFIGCSDADIAFFQMTPRFAEAAAQATAPSAESVKSRNFRAQTLFICGLRSEGGLVSLQGQRIILKDVHWVLEPYSAVERPSLRLETESLELLGDSIIEGNKCATYIPAQDPSIALATKFPAQGPGFLFIKQRGADLPEGLK